MPATSLILFDLNGVLYTYDRDARIARLASIAKRSADTIRHAIWDTGFEDLGDTGVMDGQTYLHGFASRIGYELSESEWVAALQAAVGPITDMLELLSYIHPDVSYAVLTNNNHLVQQHFRALYPEVARYIGDRLCVSAEFGVRKPDPDCYRRCLAKLGIAPREAWFIDDNAGNVGGARKAGLRTHHFRDARRFAAEARRRGLLSS
jgi:putative hydrolase of the HAD superfamily